MVTIQAIFFGYLQMVVAYLKWLRCLAVSLSLQKCTFCGRLIKRYWVKGTLMSRNCVENVKSCYPIADDACMRALARGQIISEFDS